MPADAAAPHPPSLTERDVRLVIIGAMLTLFLAALDQTIVATALASIAADLGDVALMSWVVTAYLLTATCTTPIVGKLSDLQGRRRILSICVLAFVVSSALCALAPTMPMLIAARALQGVGGGGLMIIAQAIVADVVAPRERGRYGAYFSMVWAGSSLLGPTLGGLLTQYAGWPAIFWINLPLGVLALVIADRVLRKLPPRRREVKIDLASSGLFGLAVIPFLLALSLGGTKLPWASAPILVALALAGVSGFFFLQRQHRVDEPILPPRFIKDPVVGPVLGGIFLVFGGYLAIVVLTPAYFQVAMQTPTSQVGLLMIPLMLSSTVTAAAAGRYTKRAGRYKLPPLLGLPLSIVSLAILGVFADRVSVTVAACLFTLVGFGIGPIFPVTMVAAQNAVEPRDIGTVTGTLGFARALGGAIATAAASSLVLGLISAWVIGAEDIASLEDLLRRPLSEVARIEVARAFGAVFLALAGVTALGLAIYARVAERPLKSRHTEARSSEAEA
ncbi:MAG: MFS transporter [Proteobacteria bacterium]|nr:MFS transporter [Pseudomonadota bacterium]MBI3497156.1 MFS transporter [Pseudomonadota bacterium]